MLANAFTNTTLLKSVTSIKYCMSKMDIAIRHVPACMFAFNECFRCPAEQMTI